jgi:hypothetical protein
MKPLRKSKSKLQVIEQRRIAVSRSDDNQHMGFTSENAKKLVTQCDALVSRLYAFEKRQSQRKPVDVKPRMKDNMQPSQPHPKEVK